jgi:hypothetical protein
VRLGHHFLVETRSQNVSKRMIPLERSQAANTSILSELDRPQSKRLEKIINGVRGLKQDSYPVNELSAPSKKKICLYASKGNGAFRTYQILERMIRDYIADPGKDWRELSEYIERCQAKTIGMLALSLYFSNKKSRDKLAGRCLIALSFLFLKINDPLPPFNKCDFPYVEKSLKKIFSRLRNFQSEKVLEFFLFTIDHEKKYRFLPYVKVGLFTDYAACIFTAIPFEQWPAKEASLIRLLSILSRPRQIKLSTALAAAECDVKTSELGDTLNQIFLSDSYSDALPYLKKVQTTLLGITEKNIFAIFKLPLPLFRSRPEDGGEALSVRLGFNRTAKILLFDTLMAGSYEAPDKSHWIFAYDSHLNSISWGLPMPGKIEQLVQNSKGIYAIVNNGNYSVAEIDPGSGKINKQIQIQLPKGLKIESSSVTDNDFFYIIGYLYNNKVIFGGSICGSKWKSVFIHKFPYSNVKPLGDFICYKDPYKSTIYVMNQKGKSFKLKNCHDVFTCRGSLYLVRKKSEQFFISEHAMPRKNKFKIASPKNSVCLYGISLKIQSVFASDTCVGIIDNDEPRLFFVNLPSHQTFISDALAHHLSQVVSDGQSRIFVRVADSPVIQVASSTSCREVSLTGIPPQSALVHADSQNRLYYIESANKTL